MDPKKKNSPDLVLRIDEIPRSGWSLRVSLATDQVHPSLPEAYRIPGSGGGARVEADVLPAGENLLVRATLSLEAVFDCSRCAEEGRGSWEVRSETLFVPSERGTTKLAGEEIDDEGFDDVVEFDGRSVDLEPVLLQALAVALPPYPVCSDQCAGLCPVCGVNRNRASCACDPRPVDPRWGPLAQLLGAATDQPQGEGDARSEET